MGISDDWDGLASYINETEDSTRIITCAVLSVIFLFFSWTCYSRCKATEDYAKAESRPVSLKGAEMSNPYGATKRNGSEGGGGSGRGQNVV